MGEVSALDCYNKQMLSVGVQNHPVIKNTRRLMGHSKLQCEVMKTDGTGLSHLGYVRDACERKL